MHQFVESAIEAANQGDKDKAMEFLKQVIAANPNDVDAWLVLAAVVDEPERKRQCLKRVLTLDPVNQLARDELFEMDRVDMGGNPTYLPDIPPVSRVMLESTEPPTEPAQHAVVQNSNQKSASKATPIVFQMPLALRLSLYVITALVLVMSFVAILNFKIGIFLLLFVLFIGLSMAAWYYSLQIKISEKGIIVDTHITQTRIGWNNISEIKTDHQGLELKRKNGKSVKIMSAVSGYPTIVEILRQKRPDLFDTLE
jgi:hypothetical protein